MPTKNFWNQVKYVVTTQNRVSSANPNMNNQSVPRYIHT